MKRFLLLTALIFLPALRAAAQSPAVLPDPGNLRAYASNSGKVFFFEVVGSTRGAVFGTGTYTPDSSLATVAVHAGVLRPYERGVVAVEITGGQKAYVGTARNGVTSRPYGFNLNSYRVGRGPAQARPSVEEGQAPPNLAAFKADAGELSFTIKGDKDAGDVWGTDTYTADSSLAAAAVHAGVIAHGSTMKVKVRMVPGKPSFTGSTRNGVTSQNYGPWDVAFEFVK